MGSKVIRNITKVFRSASGVLFGRATAGTGRGEELTPSQVRSLLSVYTVTQTDTAISTAVNTLIGGAPGLLDTLDELSAALGDDANFASTVTTALAGKVDSSSLAESIDDRVAALLVAGTNITITYNDALNTLTVASTASGIGGSTGGTTNRVLTANGTGGSTLQACPVTIDSSGNVSGVGTLGCDTLTTSGDITTPGTSSFANNGIRCGGISIGRGASGTVAGEQINMYFNGTRKLKIVASQGLQIASDLNLSFSSTTSDAGTKDATILRQGTAQIGIQADSGLAVRNLANSAYSDIGCAKVSASLGVSCGPVTYAVINATTATVGLGEYRVTDRANRRAYPDGTNWRWVADDVIIS